VGDVHALRFYFTLYRTAVLSRAEYRVDFAVGVVTAVLMQLAALSFYWVIFSRTTTLGGWPAHAVLLLFGLTAMSLALSELVFNGIWMLPYYIVGGEFDRMMIYPVRSLVFILLSRPELHSIGNFLSGAAITAFSFHLALPPDATYYLLPLWVLCGSLVYTALLVLLGGLSFSIVGPFVNHYFLAFQLLNASRYPVHIYPRWFRGALLFVFPVAVPIFMPARFVLGETSLLAAVGFPLAAAGGSVLIAAWFWERSISRYQSTGS
jgi:ABC-2 type transport system permease protein